MDSAAISTPARSPNRPANAELRLVGLAWWEHLVRVGLFSLPFLVFALFTNHLGFLTNAHAHVTAKALLAADRLRLEVIGFLYPPLPFLLVLVWPRPVTPAILGSVAAGATVWLLWYDLERTELPRLWRMLLLAAVVVVPANLFLATQAFPELLTLHLMVVAWHYYWNFVRYRHTFSGFVAGLILGLAFYANFYALFFALALALLVPLFRRLEGEAPEPRETMASLSQLLVTAFPALWAVASWSYINWVFTGSPVTYLAEPAVAVIDPARWGVPWSERMRWLSEFGVELLAQPLLIGSFFLNARYFPRRVVPLAVLTVLPALARSLGLAFALPLVAGIYSVLALLSLPERLPRWLGPILVVLAVAQGVSGAALVERAGETRAWLQVVTSGQPRLTDRQEAELAYLLREAPPRSILADDRSAYRIVARAETARPFLLPADRPFYPALDEPARSVQYILVSAAPSDRDLVSERFGDGPPEGFVVDGALAGWTLYRRADAPSLFAQP
jgi:hypothetical protein